MSTHFKHRIFQFIYKEIEDPALYYIPRLGLIYALSYNTNIHNTNIKISVPLGRTQQGLSYVMTAQVTPNSWHTHRLQPQDASQFPIYYCNWAANSANHTRISTDYSVRQTAFPFQPTMFLFLFLWTTHVSHLTSRHVIIQSNRLSSACEFTLFCCQVYSAGL